MKSSKMTKMISAAISAFFILNTVAWPLSGHRDYQVPRSDLAPVSRFKTLDLAGGSIDLSLRIRMELLSGLRMLLSGKTPGAVNGYLVEARASADIPTGGPSVEFLETQIVPGCERTFFFRLTGGQEDTVFKLSYRSGAEEPSGEMRPSGAPGEVNFVEAGDSIEVSEVPPEILRGRPPESTPPAGSLYGVFNYLIDAGATSPEKGILLSEVATGLSRSQNTIAPDMRALVRHLRIVSEKNVRGRRVYYVPSYAFRISKELLGVLSNLTGPSLLRPRVQTLQDIYTIKIEPLLNATKQSIIFESAVLSERVSREGGSSACALADKIVHELERFFRFRTHNGSVGYTFEMRRHEIGESEYEVVRVRPRDSHDIHCLVIGNLIFVSQNTYRMLNDDVKGLIEDKVILLPGGKDAIAINPEYLDWQEMVLVLMQARGVSGKRLVDAGCGKGMLSVAALKLGADIVDMVDFNIAEIREAESIMRLNGIGSERYRAHVGDLSDPVLIARILPGFDGDTMVVSNIGSTYMAALLGRGHSPEWNGYTVTNSETIRLAAQIPGVTDFIASGYMESREVTQTEDGRDILRLDLTGGDQRLARAVGFHLTGQPLVMHGTLGFKTAWAAVASGRGPGPVLPKPESTDMSVSDVDPSSGIPGGGDLTNQALLGYIDDGLAVEIDERLETVTRISRTGPGHRLNGVETAFRSSGVFETIRQARETPLLQSLTTASNFRSMTPRQKERLVKEAGKISLSVVLGKDVLDRRGDRHILTHVRTGYSTERHGLRPSVWLGSRLLNALNARQLARLLLEECQHVVKPPMRSAEGPWINREGSIAEADIPGDVIEHDSSFKKELWGIVRALPPRNTEGGSGGTVTVGVKRVLDTKKMLLPEVGAVATAAGGGDTQVSQIPVIEASGYIGQVKRDLQSALEGNATHGSIVAAAFSVTREIGVDHYLLCGPKKLIQRMISAIDPSKGGTGVSVNPLGLPVVLRSSVYGSSRLVVLHEVCCGPLNEQASRRALAALLQNFSGQLLECAKDYYLIAHSLSRRKAEVVRGILDSRLDPYTLTTSDRDMVRKSAGCILGRDVSSRAQSEYIAKIPDPGSAVQVAIKRQAEEDDLSLDSYRRVVVPRAMSLLEGCDNDLPLLERGLEDLVSRADREETVPLTEMRAYRLAIALARALYDTQKPKQKRRGETETLSPVPPDFFRPCDILIDRLGNRAGVISTTIGNTLSVGWVNSNPVEHSGMFSGNVVKTRVHQDVMSGNYTLIRLTAGDVLVSGSGTRRVVSGVDSQRKMISFQVTHTGGRTNNPSFTQRLHMANVARAIMSGHASVVSGSDGGVTNPPGGDDSSLNAAGDSPEALSSASSANGASGLTREETRTLAVDSNDQKYLLSRTVSCLEGKPVNIFIDLSLIAKEGLPSARAQEQLEYNMKIIAHLIAIHDSAGLDARYILEHADSTYEERARACLSESLRALPAENAGDLTRLVNGSNPHVMNDGVIEVSLKAVEAVRELEDSAAVSLSENQFVVALADDTGEQGGIAMPNYASAMAVGVTLAALREAEKAGNTAGDHAAYRVLRDRVVGRLASVFERYGKHGSTNLLSVEELDLMVSGESDTKLYYALYYALLPVKKLPIERLRGFYDTYQLFLQSA